MFEEKTLLTNCIYYKKKKVKWELFFLVLDISGESITGRDIRHFSDLDRGVFVAPGLVFGACMSCFLVEMCEAASVQMIVNRSIC